MPPTMTMRGQRRRLERDGETLDDVGAVAGHRGLRDRAHRTVADAGVVLGDPDDEAGDAETDETAQEEVEAGDRRAGGGADLAEAAKHVVRRHPQAADGEHGAGEEAAIERTHDRVVGAELDEERADDRGDDAGAADGERVDHQRVEVRLAGEEDGAEDHGGDDGHDIGLEQVGGHAGAVADVVADVVGDCRRVARIVLGDAGLDLADEVAADVGALGEDAAAETGEDGDERGAEAEGDERVRDRAVAEGEAEGAGEEEEVAGDAEQRHAGDQHARHRARLEGDVEAACQRVGGGLRRAHVGAHRDVHADVAGETGKHRADEEADGDEMAEQDPGNDEDHGTDDADGRVLAVEIGLRAFANGAGDLLHTRVARVSTHHRSDRVRRIGERQHAASDDPPQYFRHFS